MIHPSAQVDSTATLGPNVVIGPDCVIGAGTKIYDSTIMARTVI